MLPSSDLYERVELFFNGRGLRDLDVFSKSDPFLKVHFQDNPTSLIKEIGRTETINNCVNPDWKRTFELTYMFEAKQQIKIEIWDDDGKQSQLIGQVYTSLGALVGARNLTSILTLKTKHGKEAGKVVVRVEKISESNTALMMKWRGQKIMNTDSYFDFWNKSDPYLKFNKIRQDNTTITIAQTEVIKNSLEPNWKPISVPIGRLVSANQPRFKLQCWDEQKDPSKHQFIGQLTLTVDDLKTRQTPCQFQLYNPKQKKPGCIVLEKFQVVTMPTLIDYLRGGLQLNLVVAFDFTGSNGTPTQPSSLHYLNPMQPNQYQLTTKAIWDILSSYDSDQRIPAFAFGAKPKFPGFTQSQANHCFPLSGQMGNVEIVGFENLMGTYVRALQHVEFAGPTYFGPIISQTMKIANQCKNNGSNSYQILLILTDGEIHDMPEVTDLIVSAAQLPMSIIIVGVGNADFTNMQTLDGDSGLTDSKGMRAPRDLVQFVPFRNVSGNPASIAQQVLKQLPNQIVRYMSLIGKMPPVPQPVDINQLVAQKMV